MKIVSSKSRQLIQAAMRKADDDLERLEQGLAEQALHALADRIEVGRAAIHEVAAAGLGEVGHVEPQHLGVELHPQVVADLASEPRDGDAVPDSEQAFDDRAHDDEQADDQERAEGRRGQPAVSGRRDPAEVSGPRAVDFHVMLCIANFLDDLGGDVFGRRFGESFRGV